MDSGCFPRGFSPYYIRTSPASKRFRIIHRLDRANSLANWAVFFASPRFALAGVLSWSVTEEVLHLGLDDFCGSGRALLQGLTGTLWAALEPVDPRAQYITTEDDGPAPAADWAVEGDRGQGNGHGDMLR